MTKVKVVDLLLDVGACTSKSQARRLIKQGAVEIDNHVVGIIADVDDGCILRCGKHFICRVVNSDKVDNVGEKV